MSSFSESGTLLGKGVLDREPTPPVETKVDSFVDQNVLVERLARSRLRLLDSIADGIYQVDSDGRCTFMNRAACCILGYQFGEALGKNMYDLHHGSYGTSVSAANCPLYSSVEHAAQEPIQETLRRTDGLSFQAERCSFPVFERGTHLGTVVTFRDITERKRIERRVRSQQTVSRTVDDTLSIEANLPLLLRSLGEGLGFSWGALWQLDGEERALSLGSIWNSSQSDLEDFERSCREAMFFKGQDLPGRVWESAEPLSIPEIADADLAHCAAAAEAGFRSGFALPIRMTNSVFCVFEYFTREHMPLEPDLIEDLRLVGNSIAQFVERKQSESGRTRLAAILDSSPDFVGLVIDPYGTILSVSQAAEGIFGYAPSELSGQPLSTLIPEYRRHLQANGQVDDFAPGFPSCSLRMRGQRKSEEPVPLEVSLRECVEGGSRVIAGILRDVTETAVSEERLEKQKEDLRRAEGALRDQTRLVNSIVGNMVDGVIATDENGEVLLYNPAATNLFGEAVGCLLSSAEAPAAESGYTFLLPDERTPYPLDQLPLQRAVRGETVDPMEMFVKTPQRPEGIWLNGTARPMLGDDGLLRGGLLVFRDVTEQKAGRETLRHAKEEAEAANRAKSEFLSRMSHELRTPMNAILGFGQLLENEELTAEQRDAITRILKAGRHLLGLINEVLDISQIEAGHLNLQMERVRPFDVMQGAIELISPLAAQRGIDLLPPPPEDAQWYIQADRQRLTQAFVNLLANAVKYNRERGQVRVWFEEAAGQNLRIKVADTGNGLTPAQLKKLFIPFERLGAERSAIEGTGIGLAYSNRLVTAMGGSICVESEIGKGSVFWIEAPLSESEQHTEVVSPLSGRGSASNQPSLNVDMAQVLCIQDDPASFHQFEELFGRLGGYGLISANRGSIGIQAALEHAPELVLLDLQLPDTDGMKVLRELRKQMSTRQIPVVVMGVGLTDEVKRSALDAGAHSCIEKPIRVRDFLDAIACLI